MHTRQRCGIHLIIFALFAASSSTSLEPVDKGAAAVKSCAGLKIVSRARWGARRPKAPTSLPQPVPVVIIAHTVGARCSTLDACSQEVRNIQNFHMDVKGWDDIGYNFLVGEDGNVYEGRGWDAVGAHTRGFNFGSIGIAFMGNFHDVPPSPSALEAAQRLLLCGQDSGKLALKYRLYGHRQATATQSPGDQLYDILKRWSHFSAGAAY